MRKILLKNIVLEDFVNYKKPSMFLISCFCDFKCCSESGFDKSVCQNEPIIQHPNKEISFEYLYKNFINNPITEAVVLGGLEPMKQFEDILDLVKYFREHGCDNDFVIYTGYYEEELQNEIEQLKQYPNIVFKFGRFKMGDAPHFDEVLGVKLASNNQYGRRIS